MIAACYIRVSTGEQTEFSPDAQRHALLHYASQHGMTVPEEHIYMDAGMSGRRAATRPAFMSMISAARKNPSPFSVILVHRFDRFARNREDSIVYKSMLRRQCGIQVISITEHLEDDKMGLILEAMLEAMAEYYSINLADEVRKGMTEKARRGELQTSPPFGYGVKENCLVPISQEAVILKEIFHRFISGDSIAAIARWARESGILTHRGNLLDSRGIHYMLSNPVYIGKLRWTPLRGVPDSSVILASACHEPLISTEEFEKAQQRLKRNHTLYGSHRQPAEGRRHWLSGFATCAACGKGMICCKPRYLRCGGYVKGHCEKSQHISVKALEEAVLGRIRKDGGGDVPVELKPIQVDFSSKWKAAVSAAAGVEKRLQRLKEAYLCGIESLEEYQQEKRKLTEKLCELRKQQAEEMPLQQKAFDAIRIVTLNTLESSEISMEDKYRAAVRIIQSCVWNRQDATVSLFYRFSI